MTLILSLCRRDVVIHGSDRLLTLHPSREQHDTISNKAVVYEASDGVFCMGYSGIAYLQNMPTDEWLIRKILKERRENSVHEIIKIIKRSAESLSQKIINQGQLMVSLAGYRRFYQNRCFGPFFARIDRRIGQNKASIEGCAPRFFHGFSDLSWQQPGTSRGMLLDDLGCPIPQRILENDAKIINKTGDVEYQERMIVDRIRSVSTLSNTVGSNILTVTLDRTKQEVNIKFHPVNDHWARIETPTRIVEGNAHHTPWIILPTVTKPPSAEIGDFTITGGNWPINIYGAPPGGNLKGLSTSIKRTPPPR